MSIFIKPIGGLGNQLFIWATGLHLARTIGTDLEAFTGHFQEHHDFFWPEFELETFLSGIDILHDDFPPKTRSSRRLVLRKGEVETNSFGVLSFARERGFLFNRSILESKDGSLLKGYFQSWKYFHPSRAEICQRLYSVSSPSDWFTETRTLLDSLGEWIGLHFRGSSHAQDPAMGIVETHYYVRSLQYLQRIGVALDHIVIFSDDPEQAKHLAASLGISEPCFVFAPEDSRPIESMILMSHASSLIMANSTFSWWAAYMGQSKDRHVMYPRPWIRNTSFDDRDLFFPEWIGIGRENADLLGAG